MRRIFISLLFSVLVVQGFATTPIPRDTYRKLVQSIKSVQQPVLRGKYILFTAHPEARHVGIAFEHQNFREVHSYRRLSFTDLETGMQKEILFFIMPIPERTSLLRYRVVIDGLWSTDPLNPNEHYDLESGFSYSLVSLPDITEHKTHVENGHAYFVYVGEKDKYITLAGTFNRWDPFMYELKEIRPGYYELELPLPNGVWTYAYFIDGKQIPDITNGNHVYTKDGLTASVISIEEEN